jgi:hypothetical protein
MPAIRQTLAGMKKAADRIGLPLADEVLRKCESCVSAG